MSKQAFPLPEQVEKLKSVGVAPELAAQFVATKFRSDTLRTALAEIVSQWRTVDGTKEPVRQSSEFKIVKLESLVSGLEALVTEIEPEIQNRSQDLKVKLAVADKAATAATANIHALIVELLSDDPNFGSLEKVNRTLDNLDQELIAANLPHSNPTRIIAQHLGLASH